MHSDDIYLPQALEILFNVAERFNADVVHITNILIFPNDGIINEGTHLKRISMDRHNVKTAEIISTDPLERFNQWLNGDTFQELQYNIFRRDFIIEHKKFFIDTCTDTFLFTLIWLMTAKTFVKIPDTLYIRRDSPDSQTHDSNSAIYKFENAIPLKLELFANVDKFINECDFLKNNPELQYLLKTKIFSAHENLNENASLRRGNTAYVELYNSIENTFRKIFGSNAVYLALLFHWAHLMQFNKNQVNNLLKNCLKIINTEI